MTDETRAKDAQQLLENPLLTEVLDEIQGSATESWVKTRPDDTHERERLWMRVQAVVRLREELKNIVDNERFEAARAARPPLP
jgi:hypothetical protein